MASSRNLNKNDLGGVIFGCTSDTMKECLVSQLFGLPGQHISYVQKIEPGLPLFLFSYSDRKLYGVFEAESQGQMNINPYGWSSNGSERTKYPAQVRVRIRMQCKPLPEQQFKPLIAGNYHTPTRFVFELDCNQASALISLFRASPVSRGSTDWIPKVAPILEAHFEMKDLTPTVSGAEFNGLTQSNTSLRVLSETSGPNEQNQLLETYSHVEEVGNEHRIYLKLKGLALGRKDTNSSAMNYEEDIGAPCNTNGEQSEIAANILSGAATHNGVTSASNLQSIIDQLAKRLEEFKAFSEEQLQKGNLMDKKMAESNVEIQRLKSRVQLLESRLDPSTTCADEPLSKTSDLNHLSGNEVIFLLGGYDGYSWLSSLDSYSLSRDVLRSLQPMSTPRSHAAAAVLSDHIYIFGGGNGDMWYNSVESYNPFSDAWTSCPPLTVEKGNLAGCTLHGKLFAIGGGNKDNCLSDVEMFDPSLGRWVLTQSMLKKRFSPASAVLNGALYAVGGYNGTNYMNSAERFDPRAISWENLPSMNTRRGCHSLLVFKEKLYAFGGYDGSSTVSSVEVLDPRFGSWMNNGSMNRPRGYAGAVVINESIYVIGGAQSGPNIVDTVECYNEANGWVLTQSSAVGKRCFFSAVVL